MITNATELDLEMLTLIIILENVDLMLIQGYGGMFKWRAIIYLLKYLKRIPISSNILC